MQYVLYVPPSRLHKFIYCPRLLFYDHYFRQRPPLLIRLKMFLGRLKHMLHELIFRRGWEHEKMMRVLVDEIDGSPKIVLVGKPDSYRIVNNGTSKHIIVEEYKSYRGPKHIHTTTVCFEGLGSMTCVWRSDYIQALAYAYMLEKTYGTQNIRIRICYKDGCRHAEYRKDILLNALRWYRNVVLAKALIDPVYRSPNMCRNCTYRELCELIDRMHGGEK